jgi:predicted ATP-dependent endonuclease of OLD family
MSDNLLSTRLDKLEQKFETMQDDLTEVKAGVRQLTNALTGDGMNAGVIADFNRRIEHNARSVDALNATCQYIQSRQFTQKESDDIIAVVSWFKGWKLVILTLLALVPTATLILNTLKP